MPYNFLQAINKVLKRVNEIKGTQGELVSFTDSPRQAMIDTVRQQWNEIINEIYSLHNQPLPKEVSTQAISLVAAREYSLNGDATEIRWPLIDETNGQFIHEYPGGWDAMRRDQWIPERFTGLPCYAVISPVTRKLRMDTTPTEEFVGRVYVLYYDKYVHMHETFDVFPFSDAVVDALVPAVAEMYRRDVQHSFDEGTFTLSFGRACRYLNPDMQRNYWC